jgi:hypothetical protein
MAEGLCPNCINSIRCDVWGEWKCIMKERRIYDYAEMISCDSYKKRPAMGFKERKCQCEDCLRRGSYDDE